MYKKCDAKGCNDGVNTDEVSNSFLISSFRGIIFRDWENIVS